MPTKEDIQARYLRGEINHDAYQKLLKRLQQVATENEFEEKARRESMLEQQRRNNYLGSYRYQEKTAQNQASRASATFNSPAGKNMLRK